MGGRGGASARQQMLAIQRQQELTPAGGCGGQHVQV
jgi:hypothetical protein